MRGNMNDDALNTAIAKVVEAANAHRGREPAQPFVEALNGLVSLEGPDGTQKRSRLAEAIVDVTSPSGAGFIALWLGAGAESGADPSPQVQPLLDCFLRFTRQVKTDEGDFSEDELDEDLAVGLQFLGQGLVAHLSRDMNSLRALRENAETVAELERVESYAPGAMWVLELVRKVSGTLIVLHGEQPVGVRVEYRNISNCFHLFTLLQACLAEIMPGARKVNSRVLAVARGEHMEKCSDEAWWHYGQPVSGGADLSTMVFGEQNPQEIGAIDGQQVMVAWPPILESRSWDAGFFSPSLAAAPAQVELIEILSAEEIATWRDHIGLPPARAAAGKKPWWRFWGE